MRFILPSDQTDLLRAQYLLAVVATNLLAFAPEDKLSREREVEGTHEEGEGKAIRRHFSITGPGKKGEAVWSREDETVKDEEEEESAKGKKKSSFRFGSEAL